MNATRRTSWAAAAAVVGGIWGCQSILGIEDLSIDPRPDAGPEAQGGSPGDGGTGGRTGSLGGSVNQSGDSSGGGSPEGGMGGAFLVDSGVDAPAPGGPITVAGRVIDFFRRPVPDTPVTLGEVSVLTNDDGEFSFENVAPPYDVSLIAATTRDGFGFMYYAYVYQGLTRSDPTLQVYNGLTQRGANLDVTLTTADFTDQSRSMILAFSSPEGTYAASDVDANMTSGLSPSWSGSPTTTGNAHGLLVRRSGTFGSEPPLAYEAYETAPLALSDNATSSISFDLSADAITSVNLSGTVDSGTFGGQTHLISVRFNDGTILPLVDDDATASAFSYLVPTLANTSLIVAASAGSTPFAVAHADNVPAAPDQSVNLTLPRPVAASAPASLSDVGPESTFSWSTLGQTTGVYMWHIESNAYFEGIYVITSRSEIDFPSVPGFTMALSPPMGDDNFYYFYWVVETHGDYASVDAATGPDGFFDSFSFERSRASGPSRGNSGYFTESEVRLVNLTDQ